MNKVIDEDIKSLTDEEVKLLAWYNERVYAVVATEIAVEQKRRKDAKKKAKKS